MYKIIIDNEDTFGYVEDIKDAERICNEANKYNSLASESATHIYIALKRYLC